MHGSMEWKESDELLQQAAKLTVILDGVVRISVTGTWLVANALGN